MYADMDGGSSKQINKEKVVKSNRVHLMAHNGKGIFVNVKSSITKFPYDFLIILQLFVGI